MSQKFQIPSGFVLFRNARTVKDDSASFLKMFNYPIVCVRVTVMVRVDT